jgi:hypothetical protein
MTKYVRPGAVNQRSLKSLNHRINGLASRRSMILFGIRLAKCKDELRKKRKGRNDQGNGGCADCFDPSLFFQIKLTGS